MSVIFCIHCTIPSLRNIWIVNQCCLHYERVKQLLFWTEKNRRNQRHNIPGTIQLRSSTVPGNVNKLYKFGNGINLAFPFVRSNPGKGGKVTINMYLKANKNQMKLHGSSTSTVDLVSCLKVQNVRLFWQTCSWMRVTQVLSTIILETAMIYRG